MFWDKLPVELRVYILSMRNEMRQNSQKTIAKYWNKFQSPKRVAKLLVYKERWLGGGAWNDGVFDGNRMNVMIPDTAGIMEYCAKVLSGRENPNYWKGILQEVEYEMWLNQYSGGPGAEYMSRVDDAFLVLSNKFNYSSKWEEFQKSFYGV